MYLGDFKDFDNMKGAFMNGYAPYKTDQSVRDRFPGRDWAAIEANYEKELLEYNEAIREWEYNDIDVLLAVYQSGSYSGSAFVLFKQNGELFEVNSSHCSCKGLEDTFHPEATTVAALRHRMEKGNLGAEDDGYTPSFQNELKAVLEKLENEN